jgi:hypothetical protein
MSMQRKDPTEALAAVRGDAITITTEQCIKAWREAVPGALDDPTHIDIVGAMGSASSIGLGIARAAPENLYHFVFENGVYATSGGQPLPAEGRLDFEMLARGAGFAHAARFDDASEFKAALPGLLDRRGPVFVTLQIAPEVGVPSGTRSALMGEQMMAVRKQFVDPES